LPSADIARLGTAEDAGDVSLAKSDGLIAQPGEGEDAVWREGDSHINRPAAGMSGRIDGRAPTRRKCDLGEGSVTHH
jgi:hypothetical protein